jgi:hypothetical protein
MVDSTADVTCESKDKTFLFCFNFELNERKKSSL